MFRFSLLNYFSDLSTDLHKTCVEAIKPTPFHDLYAGIVCGESLPRFEAHEVWYALGLIHILVVSGSHLHFLQSVLNFILPRKAAVLATPPLLFGFGLMTGWQPPVVRSLVSLSLHAISERARFAWRPEHILLFSVLISSLIIRAPGLSFSLLLSSLAALAQSWPSAKKLPLWKIQGLTYLLLLPAILPLGGGHPLSIVVNLIYLPLMGAALFPLSLFSVAFPDLLLISDFAWWAILESLRPWSELVAPTPTVSPLPVPWLYVYGAVIHAWYFMKWRTLRKTKCQP